MLDIGDAFEIKRPATQNNLVFIGYYTKTSQKPQPEKYNRYTHKKKKESNVTLKLNQQVMNKKEGKEKTPTKTNPKQLTKGQQLEHCCCLVTKSCLTLSPPHGL